MNQARKISPNTKDNRGPLRFTHGWWAGLVFLVLMLLPGCGPYRSNAAMQDVEQLRASVLEMEASGSQLNHKRAIYAIAKGEVFLKHARVAAGHSDHTGAIEFSQIARQSFMEARILIQNADTQETAPVRAEPPPSRIVPEDPKPSAPLPATRPAPPISDPEGSEADSETNP